MSPFSRRVLIIDNDEGLVQALRIRLEAEGYECLTANTGSQGLALFSEADVSAVITDLNMPSGDGIAVCDTIKKASDVPLIIMTGFESEYIELLGWLGDIELIHKPFQIDALLDELDIAIELHEAAQSKTRIKDAA